MKIPKEWWLEIGDLQIMPMPRHRPVPRRPPWIIILVSLVCVLLIGAYIYPPGQLEACYFFSSSTCSSFRKWLPPSFVKVFTDDEIAARVVVRDILTMPSIQSKNPKIAFMFLTPGSLPFEKLWEKFFLVRFLI